MKRYFENVLLVVLTVALLAASIWLVVESFDPDCPRVLGWWSKVVGFAFLIYFPYILGKTVESYDADE